MASGLSLIRSIASRLNESAEAVATEGTGKGKKAVVARRVEYDEEAPGHPRYDVFISHRGVDTKRTVAGLLYQQLMQSSSGAIRVFLDKMSMRPGDRLEERINAAILDCSVSVIIFSKNYCQSGFCLDELAKLVEARKTVIPIFSDIKPSELVLPQAVINSNDYLPSDIERFRMALRVAKNTVGLTYDPTTGDLAELVTEAANAVLERMEIVQRRQMIVSRL